MNEQFQILKLVAEKLDAAGIAYMISGSMAVSYYAEPRFTRDIDIVIELTTDGVERLIEQFQLEFYIASEAVRDAVTQSGMFNAIHLKTMIKVDFIVRKDTTYRREEFKRRILTETEGTQLWFVAPEDLLLSKLVWAYESRSEMQLNDIRNVMTAVKTIDWHYIERWAQELSVDSLLREVRA